MEGTLTGGKKWASGTSSVSSSSKTFEYLSNATKLSAWYIELTGLAFKPSFVIAYVNGTYSRPVSIIVPFNSGYSVYTFTASDRSASTTTVSFKGDSNVFVNDSTIHLPLVNSTNSSFVWYAFE